MTSSTPPASTPDPALKGAGLSATGTTADQMHPGDDAPGTTYGDPGGTGTADRESAQADDDADAGQDATGDAEGGGEGGEGGQPG